MSLNWDKGDFDKKLAALDSIEELEKELTKEILSELKKWSDKAFVLQTDDNDQPWKPLKKPRSAPPMLYGLRDTYLYTQVENRIQVEDPSKPYALYHQYGTRTIPARRTLPGSNEIPKSLKPEIEKVINKVCEKKFGK